MKFSNNQYPMLPRVLQTITSLSEDPKRRELYLLSSLGVLSACFSNVSGILDGKVVYPNLYVMILGKAATGKGAVQDTRMLVKPLDDRMYNESQQTIFQYESEFGKRPKKGSPPKPPVKMFIIPANNTSAGMIDMLNHCDGKGLIFETEVDAMTDMLKTDMGNYSTLLRKAFHHEPFISYRKTEKESNRIDEPKMSVVMTGTPGQLKGLIPNSEDGLLSRFLFYYLESDLEFRNIFKNVQNKPVADDFLVVGMEILDFHDRVERSNGINFRLTPEQGVNLTSQMDKALKFHRERPSPDFPSMVTRYGIILFRIMMVLSVLRLMDEETIPESLECQDVDFDLGVRIGKWLFPFMVMAAKSYGHQQAAVPKSIAVKEYSDFDRLIDELPEEYSTNQLHESLKQQGVPRSTGMRKHKILKERGSVKRVGKGKYKKVTH